VIEPPAIDCIGVGEAFLAIDHDAQLVAGIEVIGCIMRRPPTGGGGHRRRATCAGPRFAIGVGA